MLQTLLFPGKIRGASVTDVFISYAREDNTKAKLMDQALGREGFTVWWGPQIPTGEMFDKVIEEALNSAKCVVLLWSKKSIVSHYVREESAEGFRREILIPAIIEEVTLPFGYTRLHTANLSDWKGDSAHLELQELLN